MPVKKGADARQPKRKSEGDAFCFPRVPKEHEQQQTVPQDEVPSILRLEAPLPTRLSQSPLAFRDSKDERS